MKNPNSPLAKLKSRLQSRWYGSDFPGGEPRFQLVPFAKDVGLFVLFPAVCILLANAGKVGSKAHTRPSAVRRAVAGQSQEMKPQIISFGEKTAGMRSNNFMRRAPGTLIKVRLLNVAETLGETPVHVRILDDSLGKEFYGGTLLGEGASDTNFSRMNVSFRFAKRRDDSTNAFPILARALSMDGTLGLEAKRKQGMFARGVLGGAASASGGLGSSNGSGQGLQSFLLQALTHGLAAELTGESGVAKNTASVMLLEPGAEFFAELKDFFPAGGR
jgi:hypothetical protein